MPLDLPSFAEKVRRFRVMLGESVADLAVLTGIAAERLQLLEAAKAEPTGDEVLILADHFRQDFRFFISNERAAPIERTEKLFRAYDAELSTADRRAIQEFLYLCEAEEFLWQQLDRSRRVAFKPVRKGSYLKGHGFENARRLRECLSHREEAVPDIFHDMRRLGVHVFRRRLDNKSISGLFIDHPAAGPCVLVNYEEDLFRQRFTAAHELAHVLFDRGDEFVVSITLRRGEPREVRANAFAGAYLVPPAVVRQLGRRLSDQAVLDVARQLMVNPRVVALALQREDIVGPEDAELYGRLRISAAEKRDPELPESLAQASRDRKLSLLSRGISSAYADLCFEAFVRGVVTRRRLAELLLADDADVDEMAHLFGERNAQWNAG